MIIGIDPGQNGAIAWEGEGGHPRVERFPEHAYQMASQFKRIVGDKGMKCVCFLEKVHAMPKQGVVSTWNFSGSYHRIEMGIAMLNVPIVDVTPQKWMKHFQEKHGLMSKKQLAYQTKVEAVTDTAWKNYLHEFSKKFYKEFDYSRDVADAMLILKYGKETHGTT